MFLDRFLCKSKCGKAIYKKNWRRGQEYVFIQSGDRGQRYGKRYGKGDKVKQIAEQYQVEVLE